MRNLITLLALISSASVWAETQPEQPVPEEKEEVYLQTTTWGISAGTINFNPALAAREGVDESAVHLDFVWHQQEDSFVYGGGITGILYSDNESFSVDVIDGFGDHRRASSSASGFGLFGEIGYSFNWKPKSVHLGAMIGVEKIWSERGISNCTDCPSENINIDSGFYLKPHIKFITNSGFTFTISYKKFAGDDMEDAVFLTFGSTSDLF
ncbi:hypothetical protein [Pleionea sp. CnH1-48]|uniref:hypothetical protein n=1 Tax=Pleionea sp. CnH1-48 TaxID=2954494 RepID=UPI002097BF27|nr:hypothetical protein [Pleionea sp. CnH1-48]MCO7226911.1 hypothetical protein [Pleionea sp. CnH1-48]